VERIDPEGMEMWIAVGVYTVAHKPTTSIEIAGYSVARPGDAEAPVVSDVMNAFLLSRLFCRNSSRSADHLAAYYGEERAPSRR
jgi:hypothetical protein